MVTDEAMISIKHKQLIECESVRGHGGRHHTLLLIKQESNYFFPSAVTV